MVQRRCLVVKVITINVDKGGVGKTTLAFNGAYYLKTQGYRVLLIDLDPSTNLTFRFEEAIDIDVEHTVEAFFKGEAAPKPLQVDEQIDLIAGHAGLPLLQREIEQGMQRRYLLAWYYQNLQELEEKYDYILIDTHNDHSVITNNALVIADKVLAIANVDADAMGKLALEEAHVEHLKKMEMDFVTGKSFVNAQVVKVGNKVKKGSEARADDRNFALAFEQLVAKDSSFLGYFYESGQMAKAKTENKTIFHLKDDPRYQQKCHKVNYEQTEQLFEKIFA